MSYSQVILNFCSATVDSLQKLERARINYAHNGEKNLCYLGKNKLIIKYLETTILYFYAFKETVYSVQQDESGHIKAHSIGRH